MYVIVFDAPLLQRFWSGGGWRDEPGAPYPTIDAAEVTAARAALSPRLRPMIRIKPV